MLRFMQTAIPTIIAFGGDDDDVDGVNDEDDNDGVDDEDEDGGEEVGEVAVA